MKPFVFNLEAVLVVRAREEQAAGESWAAAVREQVKAQENWAAAKRALEKAQQELREQRSARFRPGDQQMFLTSISYQEHLCEQLYQELSKAVALTRQRHAELLKARTKREVLTRLKQKKMSEYLSGIQAMEEAAIDDLIIVRHGRGRVNA